MTVSSVTILAPFENFDSSDLRPHVNVKWAGGTGPFDVLYEWDDNTSFTSPLTDTNVGVTSPDEGVPPSDMGGFGTDWYLRVTVTDSIGPLQEPAGSYRTLTFTNPTGHARFLYANHNVGVGFGIDAYDSLALGDGDPDLFARFLYANHNIIVAAVLTTLAVNSTFDTVFVVGNLTVLRPMSDLVGAGWDSAPTPSQPLYAQIDEVVFDDTDYIFTMDPNP